MPRPIWSGSVSFGLVSVPVKLYSATSAKGVRFHLLHDADGGRIEQKRVCTLDGGEVPWEHVVKGYEISRGRYVTVGRDELEKLSPGKSQSIEIEDFVDLSQIDPIYYETTYYLVPDKGANKPYALLVEAMKRTHKVGVARFVLRTRQSLCAVRPLGRALLVSTMLYADEVVSQDELEGIPDSHSKPGERELKMAEQLVGSLAADFDAKKYRDDFREQVLALLERKAAGEEIVAAGPEEEPRGKVVDLMDALRKSLTAAQRGEIRRAPEPHERAAARAARARPRKRRARK